MYGPLLGLAAFKVQHGAQAFSVSAGLQHRHDTSSPAAAADAAGNKPGQHVVRADGIAR